MWLAPPIAGALGLLVVVVALRTATGRASHHGELESAIEDDALSERLHDELRDLDQERSIPLLWRHRDVNVSRKFSFVMLALGLLSAIAPGRAAAQTANAEAGAQPEYPGVAPSQNRLEAEVGAYKVRLYGTILLNTSGSDASIFGQDVPLWTLPSAGNVTYPDGSVGPASSSHDLIFTMRQSIIGFTINPAQSSGWSPSGLIEADFFGPRPVDAFQPLNRVLNTPRLRKAYFELDHDSVRLVFGQDKMILAPLDPVSLSHVAMPLGATAGDLWGWSPQIRIDFHPTVGSTGLLFQFGILRPQFGDTRLEAVPAADTSIDLTSSGLGERSTQPFYQGRVAIMPEILGRKGTIGVSGHYGTEQIGVDHTLKSSAGAVDLDVPLTHYFTVRGEAFTGSNLIPFGGGISQGAAVLAAPVATAPPLTIRAIQSSGGWGELTIIPDRTNKNVVYVGAGTDQPKNSTLLPGTTRVENTFLWASYFRKLTDNVTAAIEWSQWRFYTVTFANNVAGPTGPDNKGNVINVSFAFQF